MATNMMSEISRQLFQAVHTGDFARVQNLWPSFNKAEIDVAYVIGSGADQSEEGNTLLLEALSREHLEIALFLIKNGASLWQRNSYGINALPMLMMVGQQLEHGKKLESKHEAQLMEILQIILSDSKIKENINSKPSGEGTPYKTALALAMASLPTYLLEKILPELKKVGAEYVARSPAWSKFSNRLDMMERVRIVEQSFPHVLSAEDLMRPRLEGSKVRDTVFSGLRNEKQFFEFVNFCATKLGSDNTRELLNYRALPALQNAIYQGIEVVTWLVDHGADTTDVIMPDRKVTFEERVRKLVDPANQDVNDGLRESAREVLEYLEGLKRKQGMKRK